MPEQERRSRPGIRIRQLTDVRSPVHPEDGAVLTYHGSEGKWMPTMPEEIEQLVPEIPRLEERPADGSVLVFDAGEDIWVPDTDVLGSVELDTHQTHNNNFSALTGTISTSIRSATLSPGKYLVIGSTLVLPIDADRNRWVFLELDVGGTTHIHRRRIPYDQNDVGRNGTQSWIITVTDEPTTTVSLNARLDDGTHEVRCYDSTLTIVKLTQ